MSIGKLIEAVEAGDIDHAPFWKLWTPESVQGPWAYTASAAAKGSTDAALALFKAVLPGWIIHRMGQKHGGVWIVDLMQVGEDGWHEADRHHRVTVTADDLSRALLLATLKALQWEE